MSEDGYTPTTDEMRDAYARARYYLPGDEYIGGTREGTRSLDEGGREFDRWLAARDAELTRAAAEKALREAADSPAVAGYVHNNQAGNARAYMCARADRLAAGGEDRG